MIQRVIAPVINWAQKAATLIVASSLTSIGLNLIAADPYFDCADCPHVPAKLYATQIQTASFST